MTCDMLRIVIDRSPGYKLSWLIKCSTSRQTSGVLAFHYKIQKSYISLPRPLRVFLNDECKLGMIKSSADILVMNMFTVGLDTQSESVNEEEFHQTSKILRLAGEVLLSFII